MSTKIGSIQNEMCYFTDWFWYAIYAKMKILNRFSPGMEAKGIHSASNFVNPQENIKV